jgi:ribulose-5-phosphate 4-epimerase/fuculose-1-phosphate aldolase
VKGEAYVGRKFRTDFLGREFVLVDAAAKEFIRISRLLDSARMGPQHAGNISVRRADGMLIKAGGVPFRELEQKDIVLVVDYDRKKNVASAWGRLEPSSETPMHWLIYRNFPKVAAVIHAHDPVVLANQQLVGKLGIAATEDETLYGTLQQADEVVKELKDAEYVFIRGHGSVSVGKDLGAAFDALMRVHKRFEDESSV